MKLKEEKKINAVKRFKMNKIYLKKKSEMKSNNLY